MPELTAEDGILAGAWPWKAPPPPDWRPERRSLLRRHVVIYCDPEGGWAGELWWCNAWASDGPRWEWSGTIWEPTWAATLARALAYVRTGEPYT